MTIHHRSLAVVATVALAAAVAGCGDDESTSNGGVGRGVSVTVADKGFTESAIVANAYADALRAKGFDVNVTSLDSTELAFPALKTGKVQVYPEYDGTLFLNILKKSPTDATDGPNGVLTTVRDAVAKDGVTVLDPTPYNNGNEVACTKEAVAKYGISNLTALGKQSPHLVYSANAEHLTRADGLPLLKKAYGVRFKKVISVTISLRYRPIEDGSAQCVYAFGTDPKLAKLPLTLIQDDKGTFSGSVPFRTVPLVNTKWVDGLTAEQKSAVEDALNAVDKGLTQDKIQELNAAVDLDKEDPEDVAAEFVDSLGMASD